MRMRTRLHAFAASQRARRTIFYTRGGLPAGGRSSPESSDHAPYCQSRWWRGHSPCLSPPATLWWFGLDRPAGHLLPKWCAPALLHHPHRPTMHACLHLHVLTLALVFRARTGPPATTDAATVAANVAASDAAAAADAATAATPPQPLPLRPPPAHSLAPSLSPPPSPLPPLPPPPSPLPALPPSPSPP